MKQKMSSHLPVSPPVWRRKSRWRKRRRRRDT